MPKPDPLLFGAYARATGEDRLTEVLATVLAGAPQMVAQLAAVVDLPVGDRYAVETQVASDDCRPDIEIRAYDASGQLLWILWAEHKKHAPFSTNQLTRYVNRLKAVSGGLPARLIAVTLSEPSEAVRSEATGLDVPLLRWRALGEMAERAGREIGGPAWSTTATVKRDALAPRLLREWLAFCSYELGEELVKPLTPEQVTLVAEAQEILATLEDLVEHAIRDAARALGVAQPKECSDFWWCPAPTGSWADGIECSLYLKHEADDEQRPVFVAGIWNEGEQAEALRADAETLQRFSDANYRFWDDGIGKKAIVEICAPLPMSDIVIHVDLEAQRRALAEFCEREFRTLATGLPSS